MASKRVKQLNAGMRPYVKPLSQDEDKLDIALREIAEGKLVCEEDKEAVEAEEENQTKWSFGVDFCQLGVPPDRAVCGNG